MIKRVRGRSAFAPGHRIPQERGLLESQVLGFPTDPASRLARQVWLDWARRGEKNLPDSFAVSSWATWRQRMWMLLRHNWDGRDSAEPYGCPPPGLTRPRGARTSECRRRTCVFCHARRVVAAFTALAGAPAVPGGQVVVFRKFGPRPTSFRLTLGQHVYYAYSWLRPTAAGRHPAWEQRGVALVPLHHPWQAIVHRYEGVVADDLALACCRAFAYPEDWAKAHPDVLGRAERAHVKSGRYWTSYGAIRKAAASGTGFTATGEGGPDLVTVR